MSELLGGDVAILSSGEKTWHVQYRKEAKDTVAWHPSPERAIEAACRLMDDGYEVYGIGTGPFSDSIGAEEIARIYALWVISKK